MSAQDPFQWPEDPRIAEIRTERDSAEAKVDAVTALIEPQEAKDGRVPCCQLRDALGLPRRERTPR